MKMIARTLLLLAATALPVATAAYGQASTVVLNRDQAAAILPASVFFRGQSATIQARNSTGLRLTDGKLVMAALVDTSGYSSALQQTYQAYLITEVPLTIAGHSLVPGAYGFGFVANNRMVVMDLGGNELFHAATVRDEALARPNPLQILPNGAGGFHLYLGRSYVAIAPSTK